MPISNKGCKTVFHYLRSKTPETPSNTEIQIATGYSPSYVSNAIRRLQEVKAISVERSSKQDKTRIFKILI